MYRLEKRISFEASHQLHYHDGKCARLHGHSWVAWVICEGQSLVEDGPKRQMLVDYGDVSAAVATFREEFLDHHHLNDTLGTDSPTSEFIASWLYHALKDSLPLLVEVTVEETCTSRCTYRP